VSDIHPVGQIEIFSIHHFYPLLSNRGYYPNLSQRFWLFKKGLSQRMEGLEWLWVFLSGKKTGTDPFHTRPHIHILPLLIFMF
jgi:hypothetical protein